MRLVTIMGLIGAFLTTASSLPQLYKTIKSKSSHDVSVLMFLLVFVGNIFWFTHGLMAGSIPITISAIAAMSILSLNLFFTFKYR